jgi:hypothetical protein
MVTAHTLLDIRGRAQPCHPAGAWQDTVVRESAREPGSDCGELIGRRRDLVAIPKTRLSPSIVSST